MLGVHPGFDWTALSVAALTEQDPPDAERILESLLDEHLLQQRTAERYQMHDLVRAAARTWSATDAQSERDAAVARLLDWYLHAADTATRPVRRFAVPAVAQLDPPKSPGPDIRDANGAMEKISGVGDVAQMLISTGDSGVASRVLMLYVAKGNAFLTIGLGGFADNAVALEKAKTIAQKLLEHL